MLREYEENQLINYVNMYIIIFQNYRKRYIVQLLFVEYVLGYLNGNDAKTSILCYIWNHEYQ